MRAVRRDEGGSDEGGSDEEGGEGSDEGRRKHGRHLPPADPRVQREREQRQHRNVIT